MEFLVPNSEVLTKLSQNSLKVPKIKNISLYEMKFLVPNSEVLTKLSRNSLKVPKI
jgi:hypothetical protein